MIKFNCRKIEINDKHIACFGFVGDPTPDPKVKYGVRKYFSCSGCDKYEKDIRDPEVTKETANILITKAKDLL